MMHQTLPLLSLKKHEDRRLMEGHLWIYSNEIDTDKTPLKTFQPGELVQVVNHQKKPIGIAYINPNTLLCARLLTRNLQLNIDANFFADKLSRALRLRETLFNQPFYRLIFGEGDELPGLIIDRYGDFLVLQIGTAGMENLKSLIIDACISILKPKGMLFKNDMSVRKTEGLSLYTEDVFDNFPDELTLHENNIQYIAPIISGQKTGWFYDHRLNRERICHYVKDKIVLDLFSYVGSFGILAATHGAKQVICVDSSEKAIEYVRRNAEINRVSDRVLAVKQDVFDALKEFKQEKKMFDVVMIDPPAFIKSAKDKKAGYQAYYQVNQLGLSLLNPEGFLASSSCSMHLSREDLLSIINKTSIACKNSSSRILEFLSQGPDHPIHATIKETQYLKGFICRAD